MIGWLWRGVNQERESLQVILSILKPRNSPALLLVGEEILLLGDEGLEDVGSRGDADGHVALVDHGEAVHPVLEHHPRRLGHVRLGSNAARRKKK